jgi:phenylalanyl-tRNA synthetase beta chain
MRVVLSWLREFCPTDLPAEELADVLSVRGVHVEGIIRPWDGLQGVIVARVVEVRDHPNSDTLCLARVNTGSGEQEVVVGVRNMVPGDLVPLAGPGARVPAVPEPLTARSIRGVVSNGMLSSAWELGISSDHGGILVLTEDPALGADVKSFLGLDDAVLDIEIEPNRPDLMSVVGVAREVAAATGVPLAEPRPAVEEGERKAADVATVEVLDPERCPRYLARVVTGVSVGPSPIRTQARLTAAGMRPLSNVVDATNYAMLEVGQPLHPFDLDLLAGKGIVVRRAADGERLVTLDDVERTLTGDDLVIADLENAVAIAGVMGSAPTEVHAGTSDVLIESAYFERTGVTRTSRRLGLQTEASMRFGRGSDPEGPPRGAELAAALTVRWSRGTILVGAVDIGEPPQRRRVSVRPDRASALLGYPVSAEDVEDVFAKLRITTERLPDAAVLEAEIPGYRIDLEQEVDLIEEIVRVQGYWSVGSTVPGIRDPGGLAPSFTLSRRARQVLVRAGLREAVSLSFASREDLDLMGEAEGVRIANPVSAQDAYLRTSLIPGLLRALRRNLDRGVRGVALFEAGHVFRLGPGPDEAVVEHLSVAGLVSGPVGSGVHEDRRDHDFFDAKGAIEALFAGLGPMDRRLGDPAGRPFHPARSARVIAGDSVVGVVGELHPRDARRLDLPAVVAAFEVDLTAIAPLTGQPLTVRDVPRFPPVRRDLAFSVPEATAAGAVHGLIVQAGAPLVDSVVLFDVFSGPPLPGGRKSLAFAVDFRAPDRTLTDQEVDGAVAAVVRRVADDLGGELRSG